MKKEREAQEGKCDLARNMEYYLHGRNKVKQNRNYLLKSVAKTSRSENVYWNLVKGRNELRWFGGDELGSGGHSQESQVDLGCMC